MCQTPARRDSYPEKDVQPFKYSRIKKWLVAHNVYAYNKSRWSSCTEQYSY